MTASGRPTRAAIRSGSFRGTLRAPIVESPRGLELTSDKVEIVPRVPKAVDLYIGPLGALGRL